ncbi:MAG TPA: amino acid adenylation domain-containing protein [Thermoanaerobaculia bacterium]
MEIGRSRTRGRLSHSERALWFLHRLAPESGAWNLAGAIRIENLDADALRRTLRCLAVRHPALRTVFPEGQGEPFRRVLDTPDFALVEEEAPATRERLEEEACRPFDIERGPLVRARLFRSAPGEGVLLVVLHHLVADFGSLAVFLRELGEVYGGRSPHPLAPSPEGRGGKQQGEESRRFWRERLAGTVPVLSLPADRPRPPVRTWEGGSRAGRLEAGATARLQALGRSRGATLFTILLAAFQLLLHRLSGDEEVWIGAPASGRTSARQAGEMGYFVNPVVLRSRWEEGLSFAGLVDRAREEAASSLAHRDWPFPRLAEEIQPVRDPGLPPLFQAMLVVHRTRRPEEEAMALVALGQEGPAVRIGGLTFTPFPLGRRRAQLDLTLAAAVAGGELRLTLEHDAAFDPTTAERWLGSLAALLAAAGERPDAPAWDLPRLGESERQAILLEWNDTRREAPPELSLHAGLEAQAARTPDAVALVYGGRRLTYRELDRRANGLAWRLRRRGVGPEVRVAVCAERSPELVIGLLAILKAGGAYVPLDPSHPRERRDWALADSGAPLLLTEGDLLEEEVADAPPPSPAAPDHLAYILYTSGSTGRPKGVAVEHRSALVLVRWALGAFSPEELAGVLASTSMAFDLSVFELFVPLSAGGTVILVPDVLHLLQPGAAGGVTLVNTVPSAMTGLVRLDAIPPTVRTVCLAGERLPGALAEAVHRALPGCRVLNLYGPTEDTTYSTFAEVAPAAGREPAIGRPIDGARVFLLDRSLRPVPLGSVGELCLGGAGLARGYAGRPDLTAERFVPAPWGSDPGARLYRTGDLARWRADGALDLIGRTDHQVKIRGFRIEPGEVEAVLGSHPGVAACVVMPRDDGADGKRLVAWVAPASAPAPSEAGLLAWCRERLPGFMVPSACVLVEALPLDPNGKVDRRALPEPEDLGRSGHGGPLSPAEEMLAGLIADVLGVTEVGREDDFFALGGHSLLAARLLARLRSVFGIDLPMRALFAAPTVAGLAEAVGAARREGRQAEGPALVPVPRDGDLPLSFAQERLWFLDQWIPDSPSYNVPAAVRLRGPLAAGSLHAALAEVVRRHEALRTTFATSGGKPVQVIHAAAPVSLPRIDLAGLPGTAREDALERLVREEARRPFDLWRGPLLRAALVQLGDREHVLFLSLHHIVTDGWSMGVLMRELGILYEAASEGRCSPLSALPVQYADFAVWQRSRLAGEAFARDLAWWRGALAGAPPVLELPADRPRPAGSVHRGAVEPVRLAPELAQRLRALSRRGGATLFMTLLAAFEALLARVTGAEDLVVGSGVAQRAHPALEGLIGFFVNMLPLRGDLAGDPSFQDLLARVRLSTMEAYDHQELPFERLAGEIDPQRDPSRNPLFQVVFTLQNAPMPEPSLAGLALETAELTTGAAHFDLTVLLREADGGVVGGAEHSADLFDAGTIRRLLDRFEILLHGIASDPARPLSSLPLMSESERRQILVDWNRTDAEYPRDLCIHELFARSAERFPEAVALIDGETEVTYGELARRAARLASRLRALGVGPDVPVAICLERSAEMVIGLLGILQAGGAYVPLDLGYPRERLAWMLEDSEARIVVARGEVSQHIVGEGLRVVQVDDPGDGHWPALPPRPVSSPVGPESLAYILYTSGSTGRPKGVAVSHRSVVRLVRNVGYAGLGPGETILQLAPIPFDASTFEIWGALLNGGRLAVFPSGPVSLRGLGEALRACQATTLFLTTGLFNQMVDEELESLAGLRQLLTGGDVASPPRFRRALESLPGCRLVHAYGPTEGTTFTACRTVTAEDLDRSSVPLGGPVPRTTVYLLDRNLEPVPVGIPGELYVGGDGLARGYWRRPDQTAERFVPHLGPAEPGERLYGTGDLARWLPGGVIDFLGRRDRQVKIRGFRVEPGEVESVLGSHPGVASCVVMPHGDGVDGRRLVAWVAPASAPAPAEADLLAWCRERLPGFMIPSAFVPVEALPLDPNGKIDRGALPEPERSRPGRAFVSPRTPVEEQVAAIWAEVLDLDRIGVEDDFFDLGGHSLLATQVVSRLTRDFEVDLSLRAFFEEPTVAGVSLAITREQMRQGDPERMARLLAQVRSLSHEELKAFLERDGA